MGKNSRLFEKSEPQLNITMLCSFFPKVPSAELNEARDGTFRAKKFEPKARKFARRRLKVGLVKEVRLKKNWALEK